MISFLFAILVATPTYAFDNFDGLKCGTDLTKALRGRRMTVNGLTHAESKYSALDVKVKGSDEPEQGTSLDVWQICGDYYLILVKNGRFSDVVRTPGKLPEPGFIRCNQGGKSPDVLALSVGPKSDQAWTIDYAKARFIPFDKKGFTCSEE